MPKPIKKPAGKALVKWDEKFAGLAKEATKGMVLPTGKFITIQAGQLMYGAVKIPGNSLRCVVVGSTYENAYYDPDVPFTAGEPTSPLCYAFGEEKDDMAPNDNVPEKQHDQCEGCPLNEFGSARAGAGKACGNKVRLALITENDLEEGNLSSPEIAYFRVSVTSVKNWLSYAKKDLEQTLKRPYWAVVTEIKVVPDSSSQFKIEFTLGEMIEDSELFEPLEKLWTKAMEGIDFPYPTYEKPTKRAAPVKKGTPKFAAKGKR